MVNRNILDALNHDAVVRASAATYDGLRPQGYEISVNPGLTKGRFVGSDNNPLFPDVIVWKPSYPGSPSGQAILIEEVETKASVSYQEAEQWRKFSQIRVKFLLIVPSGTEKTAYQIMSSENIRIDEIWAYTYNTVKNSYEFIRTFKWQ